MKNIHSHILITTVLVAALCGCESPPSTAEMPVTGFLSDYSGLQPISDTSYRYINPKYDLGNYTTFIIDPVKVIFDEKTKGEVENWNDLEQLKGYMRRAFITKLVERYNPTAKHPGPNIARIRIALTNVERSAPFKLGSISMEIELLDSQTNEQIGALIESQEKGVPFYGFDRWSGAKAVMDDLAERFYNRLEEAHGRI